MTALDFSWSELDTLACGLAERVSAQGVPDVIVGILRGGIVPAVMLAHRLGVRDVRAVAAVRTVRDGPDAGKLAEPVVSAPDTVGRLTGLDVLVVDDVAGSGGTLRSVTSLLTKAPARVRVAVVVVNADNWAAGNPDCPDPRTVYELIGTTCHGWVRFPWEMACA